MWRIPSERVALDLDGPSVEVERISSWLIQRQAKVLLGRYVNAKTEDIAAPALLALFEQVAKEAQPSWDIVDHLGAVPNTALGMTRLPLDLSLSIVFQWIQTLPQAEAEEPQSAVDAVIPPGPANREIKRRLKVVKEKAA